MQRLVGSEWRPLLNIPGTQDNAVRITCSALSSLTGHAAKQPSKHWRAGQALDPGGDNERFLPRARTSPRSRQCSRVL
jgi:hypothetical protein